MSDSGDELDLLDLDQMVPDIGEHELKTSPLVTKDAAAISGRFSQKGLLGTVLSTHANGLPKRTIDPRIYLNLDAPSSGLVCGVQGSGKSHTVSCILESSLMVNRQIGTLPAPLGTVVFHFDEENGERPCEAAYLSQMKKDASIGVHEVVVLVSPSNLRTRRRVYSSLKFVKVEPLRVAEQDLNAARMLSMMGADNIETMPLYMHTILSILREMGSDDFNYRDFQKRLKDPEFNKSQGAMLQLRLDLLDSFLQGDGPDVKSFFKPGRLVIIDISDPFVEATTAAMLFDICLGLFIEWKSSAGKLIVLDEAHKYLTNADANRFTRSICSIIRQQRHLAARVIVSTQEPTVVPASVLDLLSWMICHRFSSPSWVKHLKHHICAEEETNEVLEATPEWGQRVMTLRTGEALLYSPATLFATDKLQTATLATGYAIIKTRPRLTCDGGASLLATEAPSKSFIPTGIPTPPVSETLSPPMLPYTPRITTTHIPPNTPLPRIIDLVASSFAASSASVPIRPPAPANVTSKATLKTPSYLKPAPVPAPAPAAKKIITQPPAKPVPPPTAPSSSAKGTPAPQQTYRVLIQILSRLHHSNIKADVSTLGGELSKASPNVYTGKLKVYLKRAQEAGVITLTGEANKTKATLVPAFLLPNSAPNKPLALNPPVTNKASNMASAGAPGKVTSPAVTALLWAIAQISGVPKGTVLFSMIGEQLKKHRDGDYKKAGYSKLGGLVDAAVELGLVAVRVSSGAHHVQVL